jgi:hypothetical protein
MQAFKLERSRIAVSLTCLLYIIAVVFQLLLPLPLTIKLILICGTISNFGYVFLKHLWYSFSNSVICLRIENRAWQLLCKDTNVLNVSLISSFATRYVVIAHFKREQKYFHLPVILFKDSMNETNWRRLHVILAHIR